MSIDEFISAICVFQNSGFENKPVVLKKNIIENNKANYPDITDDMAREIKGNSLYKL